VSSCWACGRGREERCPWWCRERQQNEEARLREIAKLEREQRRNDTSREEGQRFGEDRERTRQLSSFDSEMGEYYREEAMVQPWTM
jgi:hypothetical protein